MRWDTSDGGRLVEMRLRRAAEEVVDGREKDTVRGNERPGKVRRRMLTLWGDSIALEMMNLWLMAIVRTDRPWDDRLFAKRKVFVLKETAAKESGRWAMRAV